MAEPEATSPCPPGGCTASPRSCEALGAERPTGQGLAGSQVGRGGEAAGLGATRCPSLLICKTVEPRDPPHRAAGRSREPARRLLLLSVCGGSLSHSTCLPRAPLRPVASAPPVLGAQDSESWGPCPGGEMVGESRYISGRCFQRVLAAAEGIWGQHPRKSQQESQAKGKCKLGCRCARGPKGGREGPASPWLQQGSSQLPKHIRRWQSSGWVAPRELWGVISKPDWRLGGPLLAGGLKLQAGLSGPVCILCCYLSKGRI